MNSSIRLINFRAKAVLCMTLVIAMNIVAGCGGAASLLPGSTRIDLTPDHPLAQALAGSPYAGATAIEVNHANNQFRLVFPDDSHQVSGTMSVVNGVAQVKQLTLGQGSKEVTVSFNESQEIANIDTSSGPSWQRTVTTHAAQAPQAPRAPSARANNVESYLNANADILQIAQQMDSQGASTVGGSGADPGAADGQTIKAEASFWPLFAVLAIVAYPGMIFATLYFIFEIVVVVNALF